MSARKQGSKIIRVRCGNCGRQVTLGEAHGVCSLSGSVWRCPECVDKLLHSPPRPAPPPSLLQRFQEVFGEVQRQVLFGKGEQRHGRGREFGEQPTFKILDLVGEGYAAGQALKKVEEARGIIEGESAGADEAAERELLGAIGYLAMLIAWRRARR